MKTKPTSQADSSFSSQEVAQWLEEHGDAMLRFALIRIPHRPVAEDLVQDSFVSALKAAQGFRGESSVRTWLIGILKNKIIDYLRKQARRSILEVVDSADIEEQSFSANFNSFGIWNRFLGDWAADPEQLLEQQQLQQIFQECLAGLPAKARQVFVLRTLEHRDSDMICNDLGISASNLWVLLHRARNGLRDCIEKAWN